MGIPLAKKACRDNGNPEPQFIFGPPSLPAGKMLPLGYVIMQAAMRLSRPVKAYSKWIARMPAEYHRAVLRDDESPATADQDPWCLGIMRHYQSLMPLAQDAQKPMFKLRPADGAIGAQMDAVQRCAEDFDRLARAILARADRLSATVEAPESVTIS